jgi:cell division protein FtsQ
MWCAVAAYLALAWGLADERRGAVRVGTMRITISDTTRVVTAEKVQEWLAEGGIDPIGESIDSVDTRRVERLLELHPEVGHVSAWTDLGGTFTVRIVPRHPAMRVISAGGYRFWFTADGVILLDRGEYTAHVPVVTGDIAFPFGPTTEGSYPEMQAAAYGDYLQRFTTLDSVRNGLKGQHASVNAEIRTIRGSLPKRLWSAGRKKTFLEGKAARIKLLEEKARETNASLAKMDIRERELREKEKKSHESHRFLSKLANFVEFISRDDFWASQIVQINVLGAGAGGTGDWREPRLELVPRAGNHTILLGELDGGERARMENLRLFYDKGLWYEGWGNYGVINIQYRNQIVCTK